MVYKLKTDAETRAHVQLWHALHVVGIVTGRPRKYGALVRNGRHCVQYRKYGKVKVNSRPIQ